MSKASDIISSSIKAREIAVKLGGNNSQDLFQESWLRVREQEIKGKVIENPLAYFYLVALNLSKYRSTKDNGNKLMRFVQINNETHNPIQEPQRDTIQEYDNTAKAYIGNNAYNDTDQFYKDFCELFLLCGGRDGILNLVDIKMSSFYNIMESLNQKLNDELSRI